MADDDLCKDGDHLHPDPADCQRHLRNGFEGRFADITDEQCCACYFAGFLWEDEVI